MRARLALAAVLLLGAAGCGSAPGSASGWTYDAQRAWRLAGDPHASVADLVDVGSIASIADSGTQRLVTYVVEPEDDEGRTQGVWRLYDERGHRIADGKLGIVAEQTAWATGHALTDGFLIEGYRGGLLHLSPDGALTKVPLDHKPQPWHAGDVLADDAGLGWWAYHQDTHDAAPLALNLSHPEVGGPNELTLDEAGVVWVPYSRTPQGFPVRWTRDGRHWGRSLLKAALPDSYLVGPPAVSGGQVLLAEAGGGVDESSPVISVWHTPAGKADWTRTPVKGASVDDLSLAVLLVDGDIVLGDEHGMYRVGGDGALSPVEGPTREGAVISADHGVYWLDRETQRAWHAASLDDDWEPVSR